MASLAEEIGGMLREKRLTLGLVESATGGLISHLVTEVPGSSDYYMGSITAYSNEVKVRLVGVSADSIRKHGAVSAEVAVEMARGGRQALEVDICLADTGIAGPGGAAPGKPVGLFFIGLSVGEGTYVQRHLFTGDRQQNKGQAAEAALGWLRDYLSGSK